MNFSPNFPLIMLLTFLYLAAVFFRVAEPIINIEIVTLLPQNFSVASRLVWTRAAFELAVDAANRRYEPVLNVSLRFMYHASHRTCDDEADDVMVQISEYYCDQASSDSVHALVSSVCTDQIGLESVATGTCLHLIIENHHIHMCNVGNLTLILDDFHLKIILFHSHDF